MILADVFEGNSIVSRMMRMFRAKEIFFHDGNDMRRLHLSQRTQTGFAIIAVIALFIASLGLVQFALGASTISHAIGSVAEQRANVAKMEARVASLQADVVAIKGEAQRYAQRLEARQAFLASLLKGEGDPAKLGAMIPALSSSHNPAAADVAALFGRVDSSQREMASMVQTAVELRYRNSALIVSKLGISPSRISGDALTGVGGPYEPVVDAGADVATSKQADPQFRTLFNTWKRLDKLQAGSVAIPSARPVESMAFTSNFGIRTDPFRGGAAMHAGVDIPGPYATPIYATADAIVGRTGRIGGYGNLVELEHGRGIQSRYGHLSSILVTPGQRIKRGTMIALMGSTGRSTGNHLHYEVRIDGRAVNPIPFLQSSDYLVAMQRRSGAVAMGGPIESKK